MIERRLLSLSPELEEREDANPLIKGHAAVFNSKSEPIFGMFREIIRPGAFDGLLGDPDVRSLINHDENLVLGRVGSKTLRLQTDQRGLYQETDPPATSYATDLMTVMRRGDVNQQSFAFTVDTENWRMENGEEIREIISFKQLFDVSVVTYPAYKATDAQVRTLCGQMGVDFEGLTGAFVRHYRGQDLSAADRDVIRRSLAAFTEVLADPAAQEPAGTSTDEAAGQAAQLEHLTRRLRLASIS